MVGTSFKDWWRFFQYNEGTAEEDEVKNRAEARNALLVVATLIAAVTFQAGVNPPGGVWQDNVTQAGANPPVASPPVANPPGASGVGQESCKKDPGTAIFACESSAYYVFLASNTLAFSAAVLVILSLMHKFPFKFEIRVAAISMIITYGSAIFAVTPEDPKDENKNITKFRWVLIIAAAPLVMRCLIQLFVKLRNREPEPPCLIQAFAKPRNKTTEAMRDESLHVQT